MIKYNKQLKNISRRLRSNMTDGEELLWSRLRRKQLLGVQFYRQKPIGNCIVDFYGPRARVVIEVDGSQHMDPGGLRRDAKRDTCLKSQGLKILRFNNLEVLQDIDSVIEVIYQTVRKMLEKEISPNPSL